MVTLELILAHLFGDFVFQSNDLLQRKYKSWTGVMEHVCIIAFFTILLTFPYWNQAYMWKTAGIIFVIHFVQDLLKIKFDISFNAKKKSTIPYFLDQIFHISLILFLAPSFNSLAPMPLPSWLNALYFSNWLTIYLIGVILFSYTYDITLYQFSRQKDPKNKAYQPNFKGMQKRLLVYSMGFGLLLMSYGSFM